MLNIICTILNLQGCKFALENSKISKIISPDEKLKTLLELNYSDDLSYFTIQKYMNKHFVKNAET